MSQENVEIVRRAIDAFARQDLRALEEEFCDQDFEFFSFFTAVDDRGAVYRGASAWRSYVADMDEMWIDWRLEDIEFFDAGDQEVVCLMRLVGKGRLSGVPVDRSVGVTYRLRSGKLWRVRSYADPADALEAARVNPRPDPRHSEHLNDIASTSVTVDLKYAAGLAYREAQPSASSDLDPVLLIHGYPQSSYMWDPVIPALATAGRRAIAPDLAGYGDADPDPPGTWEHHVEILERFARELELERVVLGVHDWGGLIGLRWACDHPGATSALILSNTGFFADAEWHSLGRALRTPGQGEQLLNNLTKDAFATIVHDLGGRLSERAIDEYWKTFTTEEGRRGLLELFRSGDFEKLAPYEGELGRLGVPALILWGENDPFVPVTGAERFNNEIANSKLVVLSEASHFLYDDEPERCANELVAFLADKR